MSEYSLSNYLIPAYDDFAGTVPVVNAAERLANPDAILTRTDLAELGWPRRGVDAIIRHAGAIVLPGYTRPVVTVADYRAFLETHRYDGRTRVR
jgi:hypothetical protein